jgi:hypothetical protein
MDLKSIAAALTDAAARLDHLETENAELAKRLTAAQCEAFNEMTRYNRETANRPRCVSKENVESWVIRKASELKISRGVLWGMVFDLISRNPDFFDASEPETMPDPIPEPERQITTGSWVRIKATGKQGVVNSMDKFAVNSNPRYFISGEKYFFTHDEIELI